MEKKNKKAKKLTLYIAKSISATILVLMTIFGLLLLFVFVSTKAAYKKGHYPPVNLYTIISPSMTPNINVYDVVVTVRTDTSKLKVGDIISFYTDAVNVGGYTITHRIYQLVTNGEVIAFRTKGDYNKEPDKWVVLQEDVVGKVLFKIPQLGRIQFFLGTKGGWLIAILIPALAIISYDIMKILKLLMIRQKIIKLREEEDIKENRNNDLSTADESYKEENIKDDVIDIDKSEK